MRPRRSQTTPSALTANKQQYRLVVMGAAKVGKTSIITRFLYDEFLSGYKKTVEDLHRGEYEVAGTPLTLDILDTSGSYTFPAMRELSISTGHAFILVYSVQDESSFKEVQNLRRQVLEERRNEKNIPIIIVGNKTDVDARAVNKKIAENTVIADWGHTYLEASAKDNKNIADIFKEFLRQVDLHVGVDLIPGTRRGKMCRLPKGSASNRSNTKPITRKLCSFWRH